VIVAAGAPPHEPSFFETRGERKGSDDVAVSVLQGVIKEVVLVLEKMRLEALYKTCCLAGMVGRPNFVGKSIPSKGVAMSANKKSNLKICPKKQTENRKILKRKWSYCWPLTGGDLWPALWTSAAKWTKDAPE